MPKKTDHQSELDSHHQISSTTVNNPGAGNCAFYAFAIGLIYIIQQESMETHPIFTKWVKLDPEIAKLYHEIISCKIRMPEYELLESLQRSLRKISYNSQIEKLHHDCIMTRAAYNAGLFDESTNAFAANRTYNKFLLAFRRTETDPDFNEFVADEEIKKIMQENASSDAFGLAYNFIALVLNEDTNELNLNSPILKAMQRVKNNYVWGTHWDMNGLAEVFEVNLHTHRQGERAIQQYTNDNTSWHTIDLINSGNVHWMTKLQVVVADKSKQQAPKPVVLPIAEKKAAKTVGSAKDLDDLRAKVEKAKNAYCKYSEKIWFSIFHRHGTTGRVRAREFYREFAKIDNYEDAARFLIEFLRNNKNGNKHPHSFRTMLLNEIWGGYQGNKSQLKLVSQNFDLRLVRLEKQLGISKPENDVLDAPIPTK